MTTKTLPPVSSLLARCAVKVGAGLAILAAVIFVVGWTIEHAQSIALVVESAITGTGVLLASVWRLFVTSLALSFWSAGTVALSLLGVAVACTCTSFAISESKVALPASKARWLTVGIVLGVVGYLLGFALFEHTFTSESVLSGYGDIMVIVCRTPLILAALVLHGHA